MVLEKKSEVRQNSSNGELNKISLIKIFNSKGSLVFQSKNINSKVFHTCLSLTSGIYYVKIFDSFGNTFREKVVSN
ncbi:MAG: T9SS type A sorting domain-containing protein [Flavobacteriales bacterium]